MSLSSVSSVHCLLSVSLFALFFSRFFQLVGASLKWRTGTTFDPMEAVTNFLEVLSVEANQWSVTVGLLLVFLGLLYW